MEGRPARVGKRAPRTQYILGQGSRANGRLPVGHTLFQDHQADRRIVVLLRLFPAKCKMPVSDRVRVFTYVELQY